MTEVFSSRPSSLADYLGVLRRHWWVVAIPLVVAPLGAFVAASAEHPVYRSTASVYINRTPATLAATGVYDPSASTDPIRFFQTQADLARDPVLIDRVARRAGAGGGSAGAIAGESSVSPSANADLLQFSVENRDPAIAARLANIYAEQFTVYQPAQTVAALENALKGVQAKLSSLRAQGISHGSTVYDELVTRESQLATALALQSGNAPKVVQPAAGASKVRPRPGRNALLGLVLGAILGIGLAFLREALDRRVWTEQAVEAILGLPLLGRLPRPSLELRRRDDIVMLADPSSWVAESYRKLRTNIEFANLEAQHRSLMITSSVEQEGKSTTIANLAVALARGGRRVVLVDLDLRRPLLNRFFRVPAQPGITDVVAGRATLGDAVRPVSATSQRSVAAAIVARTNGSSKAADEKLAFLPAGTPVTDPGEFFLDDNLYSILAELRKDWDFVLIDAPPMSAVGDALSLSRGVDAIVVVAKLGVVHQGMLAELARLLVSSPAAVLGLIVTGAEHGPSYGYGYAYGQAEAARAERSLARQDEPVS